MKPRLRHLVTRYFNAVKAYCFGLAIGAGFMVYALKAGSGFWQLATLCMAGLVATLPVLVALLMASWEDRAIQEFWEYSDTGCPLDLPGVEQLAKSCYEHHRKQLAKEGIEDLPWAKLSEETREEERKRVREVLWALHTFDTKA